MKNTYFYSLLVVLSVLTLNVSAEDVKVPTTTAPTDAETTTIDPTLAFFTALSNCTPGSYTEKNILSNEVGQANLNQHIIGISEDKLYCNAMLTTPDGRTMTCAFPMEKLPQLEDTHFMQGMLQDTTDEPSQDSVNADTLWSQMKVDSCSLGEGSM